MIYRDPERRLDAAAWLRRHRAAFLRPVPLGGHDAAVRLLIEFGELESALSDRLMPERDTLLPETCAMRRLARHAAHLLRSSWHGGAQPQADPAADWMILEQSVAASGSELRIRVPEGFAFYGLYPESYLEAATRFARSVTPGDALCIGLRTIGAPLSAVVAAALEAAGWRVTTLTLRPRGDPFDRAPRLAPQLAEFLRRHAHAHALVVDEGPGLSGSSFAGTAAVLSRLGFDDSRIIFFPSWDPGADRLLSPAARERWPRHTRWLVGFDETWIDSGRLSSVPLQPLDGGRWRELFFAPHRFPPVQPQHERRKYLSQERAPRLFKFAGLGGYGEATYRRAEALADAGFSPPVHALRHGFLVQPFVAGRPLSPHDCSLPLLDHVARYLAFLQRAFAAEQRTSAATLQEMIAWHVKEALGREYVAATPELLEAGPAVRLDGRMQPWEWLATDAGFLKTDAVDHHADHFFPGCTDVAWDLAGFAAEFALEDDAVQLLAQRFARYSGDTQIGARLPSFRLAYAAFHTGYARLAMQTTSGSPEAKRFARRAARFRAELDRAVRILEGP